MKFILLLSILTTAAFGAETNTECPMMREMMRRNNPKANMLSERTKTNNQNKSTSVSRQ